MRRGGRQRAHLAGPGEQRRRLGPDQLIVRGLTVGQFVVRFELPASGDQERLGILYWLGRALEEQGKKPDARDLYGRVFAVDIRFLDVEQRAKALAKAR